MSEVVFEVPFTSQVGSNLQDAFFRYRQKKQKALLAKWRMEELAKVRRAQPEVMAALRKKFYETAMSYLGVPYAKRYHQPDSPTHHSNMFLDCCGLVRQVLRDLKTELGFNVGPWNQAYLFDTLPISLSIPEEMQQGDLVFVSGTYFNASTKPQRHDMVHVEIWAQDGEKTLGARLQRGAVQVHDSYKFVSKTYGNMQYHFKSIDTWLLGICRSYCPQHPWSISMYDPEKHSIFALQDEPAEQEQGLMDEPVEQELGPTDEPVKQELGPTDEPVKQELGPTDEPVKQELGPTDEPVKQELGPTDEPVKQELGPTDKLVEQELGPTDEPVEQELGPTDEPVKQELGPTDEPVEQELGPMDKLVEQELGPTDKPAQQEDSLAADLTDYHSCCTSPTDEYVPGMTHLPIGTKHKAAAPPPRQGVAKSSSTASGRGSFGPSGPGQSRKDDRRVDYAKRPLVPKVNAGSRVRTFLLCGKNAAPIVEQHLTGKGWRKLEDSHSSSFTLKWVECKQHIDFRSFREGQQMVNHFPNINLLTTKIGLLESLREYDRKMATTEPRLINVREFVPVTYRLDVPSEKEEFLKNFSGGDIWICKPTGLNQGKGIFLVRDPKDLACEEGAHHSQQRVIQKYIALPLLIDGRKFDIRVYMLIIAGSPFLVFYHTGYVRLSLVPYDIASTEMCVHLTNQYQQKKHPSYKEVKEDTVWDFDKLQAYLSQHHQLPGDWVMNTLTKRMQQIMQVCFQSIADRLTHKIGFFDLLGFDFMLDSSFNVWLIEVNINPAMHTNCETLSNMLPHVVQETLDLAIEVFDKCCSSQPVLPLTSLQKFILLET